MILQQSWCAFPGAVPAEVCDRILARGLAEPLQPAGMTSVREAAARASRVAWLQDPWLYDVIFPFLQHANWQAGWLFHFQAFQQLQFTAYGPGEHYGWHVDQEAAPYGLEVPELCGLYRKLSFTLQLSEPDAYDGGALQFEVGLPGEPDRVRAPGELRARGSVVVFPSFLPHRVTPLTRGERYALVGWACGRPFL